jgi:hypothetical protein
MDLLSRVRSLSRTLADSYLWEMVSTPGVPIYVIDPLVPPGVIEIEDLEFDSKLLDLASLPLSWESTYSMRDLA